MTPEERRILQNLLTSVYDQFIVAVAEGGGSSRGGAPSPKAASIRAARRTGFKMVDDLGGLEDAIEAAAKMAGLPAKPKVIYPRRRFSSVSSCNEWPLGPVSQVLPALETLRTPSI
jgi:protease-4